jgi:hypothetical protein
MRNVAAGEQERHARHAVEPLHRHCKSLTEQKQSTRQPRQALRQNRESVACLRPAYALHGSAPDRGKQSASTLMHDMGHPAVMRDPANPAIISRGSRPL